MEQVLSLLAVERLPGTHIKFPVQLRAHLARVLV